MPETPSAAELAIPEASIIAWCVGADVDRDMAEHDIRITAAPVVAAELRRIADWASAVFVTPRDEIGAAYWDGVEMMQDRLRARAAELDPPT